MKFNSADPSVTFNEMLAPIHDQFIRDKWNIRKLAEHTGYSYGAVRAALFNRIVRNTGEASTSRRMCTLIDICRALKLAIIVKSYKEEFDITDAGYDELPVKAYEAIIKNKTSLKNLELLTGLAGTSIRGAIKEKGEITPKIGIVQYMRFYDGLVAQLYVEIRDISAE